jgi:GrpB-like predicted nucleotidyltransferase (UPF0157 family)
MDPELRKRLEAAGIDPDAIDDSLTAFRALFAREGNRATVIELYAIEAQQRGTDRLPADVRQRLGREFLALRFPGIELVGPGTGDPVEVVDYDPIWPERFAQWRERLRATLGDAAWPIEHIGSTAVPGLPAKPVIDIEVAVPDLADEPAYLPAIEAIGVPLRSRDYEHRYFRPPAGEPRVVQIHVAAAGSDWVRDHLLFRDYLRATPQARDDYAAVKRLMAERYRDDRLAYTEGKTTFILDALTNAEQWALATGWGPHR